MKALPIIVIAVAVVAIGIGVAVMSGSPTSELDRMLAAEDCDAMQYVIDEGLKSGMEITPEHEAKLEILWLKCAAGTAANP